MKAIFLTNFIWGMLFFFVQPSYSQNVLTDGDFSATTEISPYTPGVGPSNVWCAWQNGGTEAIASLVSGVCNYQITNAGYNTWELQLVQGGFTLVAGDNYRLTFEVRADADRTFGVYLGEDGGLWGNLIGYDNYRHTATTSWQTITIDFNASRLFDYIKLSFEVGGTSTSIWFDNITITDLGSEQMIGLIGTAANGWYVDVDMATSDGIIYTLLNYPLTVGAVKFRQNNNWDINWGGATFPTGMGYLYGPDIHIVSSSNYDIIFNRLTGDYSFACVSNCHAAVGILGTAVPPDHGWENDVDLSTYDGINYTLLNYNFTDGVAKFRQNDNPDLNWGGSSFPSGTASQGGPEINVSAGNYTVSFNLTTGDYSFSWPGIGILGTALTGWTDDIDMQTTDGVIYTLANYPFATGEVKFRQDNDWSVNWGNDVFPLGLGYQDGPNIPVPEGNYNVTFNKITGEFAFTATSCSVPFIQCPGDIWTPNTPGDCGAYVYYSDVLAAPNCGGEGLKITQIAGKPSGSLFPTGNTTNTFMLTNASGNTATCSFNIWVGDFEQPEINDISVNPTILWPPDHRMVPVTIDYTTVDNCGGTITSWLGVYCNELDDGRGDGNTNPDWKIVDEHHILLRAERSAIGSGREYMITITSGDESFNYNWQWVVLTVPLDLGYAQAPPTISSSVNMASDLTPLRVTVWPNPGDQYFNLEVASSSDERISLYVMDVNGRQISVTDVTDKNLFRFGDDLKPGIFFATVRQGNYLKTIRIIKK